MLLLALRYLLQEAWLELGSTLPTFNKSYLHIVLVSWYYKPKLARHTLITHVWHYTSHTGKLSVHK
jgi:hypothetical protein